MGWKCKIEILLLEFFGGNNALISSCVGFCNGVQQRKGLYTGLQLPTDFFYVCGRNKVKFFHFVGVWVCQNWVGDDYGLWINRVGGQTSISCATVRSSIAKDLHR